MTFFGLHHPSTIVLIGEGRLVVSWQRWGHYGLARYEPSCNEHGGLTSEKLGARARLCVVRGPGFPRRSQSKGPSLSNSRVRRASSPSLTPLTGVDGYTVPRHAASGAGSGPGLGAASPAAEGGRPRRACWEHALTVDSLRRLPRSVCCARRTLRHFRYEPPRARPPPPPFSAS